MGERSRNLVTSSKGWRAPACNLFSWGSTPFTNCWPRTLSVLAQKSARNRDKHILTEDADFSLDVYLSIQRRHVFCGQHWNLTSLLENIRRVIGSFPGRTIDTREGTFVFRTACVRPFNSYGASTKLFEVDFSAPRLASVWWTESWWS